MGRLLEWAQHGDVHHTYSSVASAIVYPYEGGFHWEIFIGDSVCWHDQSESLQSAINNVEGNFVGRSLKHEPEVAE